VSDLLLVLVTFVATVLSAYLGWWAREWTLRHRSTEDLKTGTKRCAICQKALPERAIKSVSGWRCAEHKSVA
jgi:hypothetical protein